MTWGKALSRTAAAGLVLAGIALSSPAAAGVVVKSSGPSAAQYPVGKKVDDASSVTLKAGDSITVLTANGTRVISGAGTHTIGARGTSKRSAFAVLSRQRSGARVRTGAVRGGTGGVASTNPNLWNLDVARGGRLCLADSATLNLWRGDTQAHETYMFGRANSDFHVHVAFEQGMAQASVTGDELPLAGGQVYTLTGPTGNAAVPVEFVVLDSVPEDPESMAALLAANGCQSQLDLLADKLMMAQ